jgi:hypothetical protein
MAHDEMRIKQIAYQLEELSQELHQANDSMPFNADLDDRLERELDTSTAPQLDNDLERMADSLAAAVDAVGGYVNRFKLWANVRPVETFQKDELVKAGINDAAEGQGVFFYVGGGTREVADFALALEDLLGGEPMSDLYRGSLFGLKRLRGRRKGEVAANIRDALVGVPSAEADSHMANAMHTFAKASKHVTEALLVTDRTLFVKHENLLMAFRLTPERLSALNLWSATYGDFSQMLKLLGETSSHKLDAVLPEPADEDETVATDDPE